MRIKTFKLGKHVLLRVYKPSTFKGHSKLMIASLIELTWNRFLPIFLVLLFVLTTSLWIFPILLLNCFVDLHIEFKEDELHYTE